MAISYLKPTEGHGNRFTVHHDEGITYLQKIFPSNYFGGYKLEIVKGPRLSREDFQKAVKIISGMKFFDVRPKPIKEPNIKDYNVRDMVPFPDGTVKRVVSVNGKKTFSRLSALLNEADAVLNRVASSNTRGNPLLKVARSELMEAYQDLCDEAKMILLEHEAA